MLLDDLRDAALAEWHPLYTDGGDLGMLVMRALSGSCPPSIQQLRSRLQAVEQAFVRGQEDPGDVTTLDATGFRLQLLDLKWGIDVLSIALPPLLRPGEPAHRAWLLAEHAGVAAESFAARLQAACIELADLREAISGAFAFASAADSALQLERATESLDLTRRIHESERERGRLAASEDRARILQDAVTLIAAVLLGPGVIAAIYGALPTIFDERQELRATTMFGLMGVTGLATWVYLRHRSRLHR